VNTKISDLRQEYTLAQLDVTTVAQSPYQQFRLWFTDALNAELKEPNAMVLSTTTLEGGADARTVLLKDFDESGFVFYTNYMSDKAAQLESNNKAHLLFLWLDLERQVRIKGVVSKVNRASSEAYFQSRPRKSQIGAWASPQSNVISDRSHLEARYQVFEERFKTIDKIPLPDYWGGYVVVPNEIEFWQGRRSRLHDRIVYKLSGNIWKIMRLAP
jgi:pyridoxamine 5'-phosphate oxidase